MRKLKRLAAIGAATVLAAGLLAGCWRAVAAAVLLPRRHRRQIMGTARRAAEAETAQALKRLTWYSATSMRRPTPGTRWQ